MKKLVESLGIVVIVVVLLTVGFNWRQKNRTHDWQKYTDEFLSFQIPKDWLVENSTSFYKVSFKGMPVMDIYLQNNPGNKYSEKSVRIDMKYLKNFREISVDNKKAVRYRNTSNPLNGPNQENVEIFLPDKEKIIWIGFFGKSEILGMDIVNYFEPFLASLSIN